MRNFKSTGKKLIEEVQELRARRAKLERVGSDITERTKAEEKLRQSEQRFRSIFDNANDIIGFVNTTGEIIEVNKKVADILGYKPDELIGKNFMKCGILPIKNAPRIIGLFKELVKRRGLFDVEGDGRNVIQLALRHKKGHTVFVEASTTAIKTDGKFEGFLSVLRDITERKRAEQALRESEERYRAIFEQAADPIVLIYPKTAEIVEFNDMAHENLGYTREEFGKLKISDLEVIESPKEILKHAEEIVTGGADNFETKKRTKSGEVRDYQVNARAITLHGRDFIQSMWYDTTERKKAEEALRESEEKLRTLVERANDGIAILQDGVVKYVNPRTAEITGYTVEEMINTPFTRYVHPDEIPKLAGIYERRMAGEEISSTYETVVRHKDGSDVHVEINTGLLTYEGKPADFAFARDITERKKAEEELRLERDNLINILNSMEDGVYIVGQDYNTQYVNPVLEKEFGPFEGRKCYEYLHERRAVCDWCKSREVFAGRTVRWEWYSAKNQRTYDLVDTPLRNPDGTISKLGIFRDITERKYTEQRLLQERAKLKSLASQLTLAEEHERRRIAIELHDRIGQSLAISKMNLEALRKSDYGKKTDETLDEICNLLAQTIANTRTLTFDLSSPILYELGFETAVAEWLTEEIQDNHGIATQFEDDGRPKPLDDDIRILLFRNVRELLINVVKHARAHKVKVSIRKVGKQMCVSVEDDGVGFDPAEVAPTAAKRPEFGLFSIRQRLEELGGHLEIDSEPGLGCMVTMTAPIKQK